MSQNNVIYCKRAINNLGYNSKNLFLTLRLSYEKIKISTLFQNLLSRKRNDWKQKETKQTKGKETEERKGKETKQKETRTY